MMLLIDSKTLEMVLDREYGLGHLGTGWTSPTTIISDGEAERFWKPIKEFTRRQDYKGTVVFRSKDDEVRATYMGADWFAVLPEVPPYDAADR